MKILAKFISSLLLIVCVLNVNMAYAQVFQINPDEKPQSIIPLNKKAYEKSFFTAKGDTTIEQVEYVSGSLISAGKMLLSAIAILLALTGIVGLIVAQDKEEQLANAKRIVVYSVIGLALIALSSDLAKILDLTGGGLLGEESLMKERVFLFDNTVRIIITFIKYLLGAIAVLMLSINALNLVTLAQDEDETTKAKMRILYISGSLFLFLFLDNLIKNVLFKIDVPGADLAIDLGQGIRELVGFTNLLVSFVGPIAIITLIAGGAMYAGSFGNEDTQGKAKKMIITSLVGIVVIYGAFGLVSTLIAGKL